MQLQKLISILLMANSVWVLVTISAIAGEVRDTSSSKIRQLSEIERPMTSAQMLVQAPTLPNGSTFKDASEVVQVTGVKVNPTAQGVEVILETSGEQQMRVLSSSYDRTYVANILNARLALLEDRTFRTDNPVAGITTVTVTQPAADSVRVTVIGKTGVPSSNIVQRDSALVLGLTAPTAPTAQQPTPPPNVPQTVKPESEIEPETTPEMDNVTPEGVQQPPAMAEGDEEQEIVVTGDREGYSAPDASTATKTDTPLRDIPANIQVIPQQVLEDQGVVRLEEAVRNVSGVNFSLDSGAQGVTFNARGFTVNQFKNGLEEGFATRSIPETANLERIEVLKGPASVLFGQAEPGGLINQVTKRPLPDPFYKVEFTAGSYDFYRPTLDFSGPLNSDKTLAYRLNVAYENTESFRDRVEAERFFIAPVLTWQIGANTTLTLEGEYFHDKRPIDRGLVAVGDEPADIPFTRFLGDPRRRYEIEEQRAYLYLDHRFNQNLSLRNALRFTRAKKIYNSLESSGGLEFGEQLLPLFASFGRELYETYTLQTDLIGKFNTGTVAHTVLLGLELARQTGVNFDQQSAEDAAVIDIFNPSYDFPPIDFQDQPGSNGNTRANTIGVYLQDQIALLDNLKLVLGGRFDSYDAEESYRDSSSSSSEASEFSPRAGIVYQPSEAVSLYANYSRAFVPQAGRITGGGAAKPERGTQYEVGVKANFLDNRLSSTLAAYEITKSNVLTEDPSDPDLSIQVGEQRSRGIEFDLAGEILPGWNIIASYAYTDAEITEDNTYEVGNRLNNVPFNTASLWTTYRIQKGSLEGLGFGAGIFYVDSRQGDLNNSFEVPGYTRVDAAIYYEKESFKAVLNFKNLFDVEYFVGVQNRRNIPPGEPFTVQGTISWEF
jgi:iron complex outermembrane recepter protein